MNNQVNVHDSLNQDTNLHPKISRLYSSSMLNEDLPPILIVSNEDFKHQANEKSWLGNGTLSSPYIINGFNITGYIFDMIHIRNTNVYFQINNVFISGGNKGIYLYNVSNGFIANNTIRNNAAGISLHKTWNTVLSNNSVKNTYVDGITVGYSSNITLVDNTINKGLGLGILIWDSSDCILSRNNISDNYYFGAQLKDSDNCSFISNRILNNGWNGIDLKNSNNCEFYNNIVSNNGHYNNIVSNNGYDIGYIGINVLNSENCLIYNNILENNHFKISGDAIKHYLHALIENNSVNGKKIIYWNNVIGGTVPSDAEQVILVNCNSVEVRNQTLVNLQIINSSHLQIQSNLISQSSHYGIIVDHSDWITISFNNITDNDGNGIDIQRSLNNQLSDNFIMNNRWNGIEIWDSYNINPKENQIINNSKGIFYYESVGGMIYSNTITNNSNYGIDLVETSDLGIFSNNFVGNNADNPQAYDDGDNNIFQYNFWSDRTNPDSNNDGYVDFPYNISGQAKNQDIYPRTISYGEIILPHILTVPSMITPNGMETIATIITIEWASSFDSHNHILNYKVYFSADSGAIWIEIGSYLNITEIEWDTTNVQNGQSYLIKVVVICSNGETAFDISDWLFEVQNSFFTTVDNPSIPITTDVSIFFIIAAIILLQVKRRK